MSERDLDWACGYYDRFQQELVDGELTTSDIDRLFKENKITSYQYEYAKEYLKGE